MHSCWTKPVWCMHSSQKCGIFYPGEDLISNFFHCVLWWQSWFFHIDHLAFLSFKKFLKLSIYFSGPILSSSVSEISMHLVSICYLNKKFQFPIINVVNDNIFKCRPKLKPEHVSKSMIYPSTSIRNYLYLVNMAILSALYLPIQLPYFLSLSY